MPRWWKNLSVSKKLYAVFGVMAFLILIELLTLRFAMGTLSSVRAFVEGEGLWSKGQKNAIQSLYQYAFTGDSKFYDDFHRNLKVPFGDRQARLEILKSNADSKIVFDGFEKGGIHPGDIPGVISLLQRFHEISYIKRAIAIWTRGDLMMDDLIAAGEQLDLAISKHKEAAIFRSAVIRIGQINENLTELEVEFSHSLGEGSRWLETLLLMILMTAVFTVECTGLLLTFSFSRTLTRSLQEITRTTELVGDGDFSGTVPVRSQDELGQLAMSLNKMIFDLRTNISQRQRAENASHTKTVFLANTSHELRTPLGVILGFVEILKDPQLSSDERLKYLEIVDQTGKNLSRIINDILDISKVEAGHLDLEVRPFSFNDLIEELSRMLALRSKDQRTALCFRTRGYIPDQIATDRIRLRQIMLNLINNALKFTRDGQVTVTSWTVGSQLHFEVSDTGIGISDDQRAKLFQRFSQAESTNELKTEGSGLGLILSRGLAQALGGNVSLKDSRLGYGSTFAASIHLANGERSEIFSATKEENEGALSSLKDKRILIVDDTPENQMVVGLLLRREGVDIESAGNGRVGVEKALTGQFDVVLMDMQMPVMDGYEATKQLRKRGYLKPIIALTAHAMKEDQIRCLEAGCNAYVSRPIESCVLLKMIANATVPHSPLV